MKRVRYLLGWYPAWIPALVGCSHLYLLIHGSGAEHAGRLVWWLWMAFVSGAIEWSRRRTRDDRRAYEAARDAAEAASERWKSNLLTIRPCPKPAEWESGGMRHQVPCVDVEGHEGVCLPGAHWRRGHDCAAARCTPIAPRH